MLAQLVQGEPCRTLQRHALATALVGTIHAALVGEIVISTTRCLSSKTGGCARERVDEREVQ